MDSHAARSGSRAIGGDVPAGLRKGASADQVPAAFQALSEAELIAYCRDKIDKGSKSFAGAARLFDPATRQSAMLLYAWCRFCDDVVDGQVLGFRDETMAQTACSERLSQLRADTVAALNGSAVLPEFQALALVAARHDIPPQHPLDLIEGFAMDVGERHYETIDDTLSYCYHVAGVVGVMMALIMGVKDHETLKRASDLGIAFQLSNISRDVIEDARNGRVYLPAEILKRHGLAGEDLAASENRERVFNATRELIELAERYYASAGVGISELPVRSAWAIAAARRVYRDISRKVLARGASAWDTRTVTSKWKKAAGVGVAGLEAVSARPLRVVTRPQEREGLWTPPFLRGD